MPWSVHGAGPTAEPTLRGSRTDRGMPLWSPSWRSTPACRLNSSSRQTVPARPICWLGVSAETAVCLTCGCRGARSSPCNASASASPPNTSTTRPKGHPRRPEGRRGCPVQPTTPLRGPDRVHEFKARRLLHAKVSRQTTSSRIVGHRRVHIRHRQHPGGRLPRLGLARASILRSAAGTMRRLDASDKLQGATGLWIAAYPNALSEAKKYPGRRNPAFQVDMRTGCSALEPLAVPVTGGVCTWLAGSRCRCHGSWSQTSLVASPNVERRRAACEH